MGATVEIMNKRTHIILDVVSMVLFMLGTTIWARVARAYLCIIILPFLFIRYCRRIFRWILFWIDSRKEDTQTVITKGYVFRGRYRIYELDITKKIYYSVIQFNDPRLKGEYIDLSDERHRQGDTLEIVFYRRSRVIKHITKLED